MGFKTDTVFPHIPAATLATSATFPPEKGQNVANVADVAGGYRQKYADASPSAGAGVRDFRTVQTAGATVSKNAIVQAEDDEPGEPAFKPLRCIDCPMWQDAGSAYWVGRCGRTGHKVGFRSRCELGVPEVEKPGRGGYMAIGSRMGHRGNAKPKHDH